MGWLVLVLVVAGSAGAVALNRRNSSVAMTGVDFAVPGSVESVRAAIRTAYCGGAKASLTSLVLRVKVQPAGDGFTARTSIGDVSVVEISGDGAQSRVRAHATELYIGSPPSVHLGRGAMGLASQIVHGVCKALDIAPNASKINGFQRRLEGTIAKQLAKQTRS